MNDPRTLVRRGPRGQAMAPPTMPIRAEAFDDPHGIGDAFCVGGVRVTVTPADHAWQNAAPQPGQRTFLNEDSCGFWIETPDGEIWAPGDSRLIREHDLTMPNPDALAFSEWHSEWHFTFDGAVEMAYAYPTRTCCVPRSHGTSDA